MCNCQRAGILIQHNYEQNIKSKFFIKLGYRDELFLSLEQKIIDNEKVHVEAPQTKTLASKGEQISKQDVINRHRTRGLDRKDHVIPQGSEEVEGSRRKRKSKE